MGVSLIVAVSSNYAIGKDNDLLWHLPDDLKYFKSKTLNNVVIMGRKSWESIPVKYRPLPNRTNIVITNNQQFKAQGAIVVNSIDQAIAHSNKLGAQEVFITGGGQIYKQSLDEGLIDTIYLTKVHASIDGDVYFPEIDEKKWELVEAVNHSIDAKHIYAFTFCKFQRVK